jgi:tetratricopeptide (TPR) repeat protein
MRRRLALVAALALACAGAPPPTPQENPAVSVTTSVYTDVQQGPFHEICEPMAQVGAAIEVGAFAKAEEIVDGMVARFDALLAQQPGKPLSVASQAEFDEFQEAAGPGAKLFPLDWCWKGVMQHKAFLQVHRGDLDGGLVTLDRVVVVAPTAADSLNERGFILNQQRRFPEARTSYERALAVSERYPASKPDQPVALRGLGYVLIELGELDAAQQAFERSLVLDPGNEIAENELLYIDHLREQR